MRPKSTVSKLPRIARHIHYRLRAVRGPRRRIEAPYSPLLSLSLLLLLGLAVTIGS
jgi:hypothetical protein